MFCCLCIKNCTAYEKLLSETGQQNEVYEVSVKYFKNQLQHMDCSEDVLHHHQRVICEFCWGVISNFHKFQNEIISAHEEHERLLKFEVIVKQEDQFDLEVDYVSSKEGSINIGTSADPVEIAEAKEIELKNELEPDPYSSSIDDDVPLCRLRPKSRKPRKNSKSKSCVYKLSANNESKLAKCPQTEKTAEFDSFIANWKDELQCALCSEKCTDFTLLCAHFRTVHDRQKGYVLCCHRKFFNRFHLVDHLRLHLDPELFKCSVCGKCSANRRSLKSHMQTMHAPKHLERPFECKICHKCFAKESILRSHMDIHATGSKDYICPECGKGFVLEKRLHVHIRTVHNSTYSSVCELCGKTFRDRYVLKRHLLEHNGVEKIKWPCDQCDSKLHSKYSLRRHKQLAHNDGTTAYVCSECGKVSLTEHALRSHKKFVHEKERNYKCNICNKAFKVAVVLKEHMTTHTGQELYQCPHCPKRFKVSSNMHHHRKRVHPKEWAANHQRRKLVTNTDLSLVSNEVVL